MPKKAASARIPRDEGAERLISAVLTLGRAGPIAKLTVRDIAATAGLQTMHLKRYFGSRNELLLAVSNRLMQQIVSAVADKPLSEIFPVLLDNPDVALRLRIVSHLLDEGLPPDSFDNDRTVYLRVAERISTVNNVDTRTAHTYALIIQLVLQGSQLMGDANGLNSAQRQDIFNLLVALAPDLHDAEARLVWH